MLAAFLICIIAYVMGSIPTGYWICKLIKGVDLRTVGSKSTGATNVLRTCGKGPALFVFCFDIFKGAFPVLLAIAASDPLGKQLMPLPDFLSLNADPSMQAPQIKSYFVDLYVLPGIAGILAMIGHSKSVFLGFSGGKSAATGLGTLASMNPWAALSMLGVFASTIYIGRYVSVGSMAAAFSGPFFMHFFTHGQRPSFVVYNIIGSLYVIIRHKANIERLIKGTEPKIGQKVEQNDLKQDAEKPEGTESDLRLKEAGKKDAETEGRSQNLGVLILFLAISLLQPDALGANTNAAAAKKKTAAASALPKNQKKTQTSFQFAPPAPVTAEEATNIKVYKDSSKAVVNVTALNMTPEAIMYGFAPPASDTGSGSIISEDGYVLTNNHVVNGANMVRVTLFDGTPFPAKLVGIDPDNDLAVLKIDPGARKLTTIKFGDSSRLEVGRKVYAIGNPFGLDLTMTSGIISSVGRTMRTENHRIIKGVLQTDASINPGNSGGPLLDTQGSMIGVTTAILSKVQQSAGIGFAIPINIVKRIVPQLIAHGAVLRPNLGISKVRLMESGLMVVAIEPAGPASEAGIKGPTVRRGHAGAFDFVQVDNSTADIIVGVDSQRVASVDDLLSYIETKKPGQVVTLNVLRQGQVVKLPVKLAESKAQP